MDQYSKDEVQRLEAEVAEREQRLQALKAPMSVTEAGDLARDDPDTFNRRYDAAKRAGRQPIVNDKETP